ncbi:MAG: LacI family transcriptional regulator [Propionibacteriaceae bacterium]|jgi:LacI family transcriptional regulator|nr:LacI family transcriptional regulator [Propionibacteriaceae bacterium]
MATLSDVARLAGVSLSTASRALNGSRDRVVKPELARRVLDASRQLNYSPNAAAQAMARGHSNSIGLIVHDIRDPFFSSIAAGVMRSASERGYVVTLATTFHHRDALLPLIDTMRQQRAEALILAGSLWDDPAYLTHLSAALADFRSTTSAHISLISQSKLGFNSVTVKNRLGAQRLASALWERGFTTAAILSGQEQHITSAKRVQGFLRGFGGEIVAQVPSEFTREGGYQAMKIALSLRPMPQLVFAVNDVMAVGALAAAREAGVRIPQDMAVAGFDDIPTLSDVTPPLTTVRVPMEVLGEHAVELALMDPTPQPQVLSVSTELIFRESTAVVPSR